MAENTYERVSISLRGELLEAGQCLARKKHQSFSGYVSSLLERDLKDNGYLDDNDCFARIELILHEAVKVHGPDRVLEALRAMLRKEAVGE